METDEHNIEQLCKNLHANDEVWRSPIICPGKWQEVTGDEAAAFFRRWIELDRVERIVPTALLLTPLRIWTLDITALGIRLWQVAVDAGFDAGTIDFIDRAGTHFDRKRFTTPRISPRLLAQNSGQQSAIENHSGQADDMIAQWHLSYLRKVIDTFPSITPHLSNGVFFSPSKVVSKLTPKSTEIIEPTDAKLLGILAISLSRRSAGRLSVIDPDFPLATCPQSETAENSWLSNYDSPSTVAIDDGWLVDMSVWLGSNSFRIQLAIEKSTALKVQSVETIGAAPPKPMESNVQNLRLTGFDFPKKTRLPSKHPRRLRFT